MIVKLETLNPAFRQLTDLLLFSESSNLNLDNYYYLLKSNYNTHLEYFSDRLEKSSNIFWESNFEVWYFRLNFLLSLKDKSISNRVTSLLEKRMFNLSRRKVSISAQYDIEFLQYLVLCQVKKDKHESLDFARKFLEELPSHYRVDKTIDVVKQFVPVVYENLGEYAEDISKKICNSTKNFTTLKALEKEGIEYNTDWLIELSNSIIIERVNSDKNRRLFFELINDKSIIVGMKKTYSSMHKVKLINLINQCDYSLLEGKHLNNIKNLIELDPSITSNIVDAYIKKLYSRQFSHLRSNADRLIKLINQIPEITPRVVLSTLSAKNKLGDIKYILPNFPEIKNLTVFL